MKRVRICVISFILSLVLLIPTITAFAGASPKDLTESQLSQAKELYQYLISNGYSKESACGILGNTDQEHSCDGSGLGEGTYSGAFQCNEGQASQIISWAKKNNLEQNNAFVQFTWIEANCLERYFKESTTITFEEFKKLTSVEDAADAFCVAYERCVGGSDASKYNSTYKYQELDERKEYAKEFLAEFAGITAVEKDGSNIEGDGTSGISIEEGVYGIKDPMTDLFVSLKETALAFPDSDSLSDEQLKGVVDWKNNIDYENDDIFVSFLRIVVMLFGILLLVWVILIYLSYWFDRINNFIDLEILPIVTGGKLRISPEEHECTFSPKSFIKGQAQTVNHKVIVTLCVIGVFFSVYIITGHFYTMLNSLVRKMLQILGVV